MSLTKQYQMFDYFFAQYKGYPLHEVYLELIAVFFGLWSVWCAKKDNIWAFSNRVSQYIYICLLALAMELVRRFHDQCVLFHNEYLWMVPLDA